MYLIKVFCTNISAIFIIILEMILIYINAEIHVLFCVATY